MTAFVSCDSLTRAGPLAGSGDERVLLIEASAFARRKPYHPHKLTLVFSAMRHFRDELRADGYTVEYYRTETFEDGLSSHFDAHPETICLRLAGPHMARTIDSVS